MFRKPLPGELSTNVEGRACFVINSAIFIGQVVAAFITGPIIKLFQTATAAIMVSCVSGAVAVIISIYVEIP